IRGRYGTPGDRPADQREGFSVVSTEDSRPPTCKTARMKGAGPLPSGVVSFLLTDIVGSTSLWDAAPEAMERAVARCEEVIAAAVARHDGVVLKERGEGDSTFSVFGRASDAVRAAYEAQTELLREAWPDGAPINVRMAVHAGEASERDGDYFGTTVNRAA